jgi:hypothetical protein
LRAGRGIDLGGCLGVWGTGTSPRIQAEATGTK